MTLKLDDEEAICLDDTLTGGNRRTISVQVNVSFVSDAGVRYHGSREIKIRLRRETDTDIQAGR